MSLSQDGDLDCIISRSRLLNVDSDLAVRKYYDIYRYLRSDLALTKEQLLSIAKIYTVADCNLGKLNDVKKAYLKKVV